MALTNDPEKIARIAEDVKQRILKAKELDIDFWAHYYDIGEDEGYIKREPTNEKTIVIRLWHREDS